MEEEGEGEAEVGANAMDAEDHQTAGNPDGPAAANRTDMHTAHGQRKRCGSIEWNKQESGNWRWSSELHGKDSELKKQKLGEVAGQSEPTESWTFCHKLSIVVNFPDEEEGLQGVFWEDNLVPHCSKHIIDWRSNLNMALRAVYLSK